MKTCRHVIVILIFDVFNFYNSSNVFDESDKLSNSTYNISGYFHDIFNVDTFTILLIFHSNAVFFLFVERRVFISKIGVPNSGSILQVDRYTSGWSANRGPILVPRPARYMHRLTSAQSDLGPAFIFIRHRSNAYYACPFL